MKLGHLLMRFLFWLWLCVFLILEGWLIILSVQTGEWYVPFIPILSGAMTWGLSRRFTLTDYVAMMWWRRDL